MSLTLHPAGREYLTWPVTGLDGGESALEVSADGTTWVALTTPSAGTVRVLVAGPDATSNPAGTLVLPLGSSRLTVRVTDSPEVVIRSAATIYVQE